MATAQNTTKQELSEKMWGLFAAIERLTSEDMGQECDSQVRVLASIKKDVYMAARQWTPEQRARQSAMIRHWQPWKQSTGARTPEGKAVSSQNVIVGQRNRQMALEQAM